MDKTHEEILAKDAPLSFNSTGVFYIVGRGKAYSVQLPFTCAAFDWILNRDVNIDGAMHKIIAIEKKAHNPPWRKGEEITLLVDEFYKS